MCKNQSIFKSYMFSLAQGSKLQSLAGVLSLTVD